MSQLRRAMMRASRQSGGELPTGYTAVEAIQNGGAAYIDTLWTPKVAPRLVTELYVIGGSDQDIVGMDNTAPTWSADIYTSSNGSCYYRYGSTSYQFFTTNIGNRVWASVDIGKDFIVNGVNKKTMADYDFSSNTKTCRLFSGRNGRTQNCAMKRAQLYDGDTMVRDFVPCKNEHGVCGMYDMVNGEFYASVTTTNFSEL